MKITITNLGSHKIKVMTHGESVGSPDDPDHDNGIVERFIEPAASASIEGDSVEHLTVREYTPTAEAAETDVHAG